MSPRPPALGLPSGHTRKSRGPSTPQGPRGQLSKAQCWSSLRPTTLSCQVSWDAAAPLFGAGQTGGNFSPEPQMCFESKAPDLAIPSANPTSLACSGTKSTVGRSGPTRPALPLLSLLPATALAREAGSYLFHQTLPPQPGQQAEEVSLPLKSAKCSSRYAKNNKK